MYPFFSFFSISGLAQNPRPARKYSNSSMALIVHINPDPWIVGLSSTKPVSQFPIAPVPNGMNLHIF